jgi:hypothetical protein
LLQLVYFGYPQAHEGDAERAVRDQHAVSHVLRDEPSKAAHGLREALLVGRDTSRRSSGSIRVDSAVEPTKSENITVTWRRSARSSGCALWVLDLVAPSTEGVLTAPVARREKSAVVPERRDAQFLQVLCRQGQEDRLVYLILAEDRLVLCEAPFGMTAASRNGAD